MIYNFFYKILLPFYFFFFFFFSNYDIFIILFFHVSLVNFFSFLLILFINFPQHALEKGLQRISCDNARVVCCPCIILNMFMLKLLKYYLFIFLKLEGCLFTFFFKLSRFFLHFFNYQNIQIMNYEPKPEKKIV